MCKNRHSIQKAALASLVVAMCYGFFDPIYSHAVEQNVSEGKAADLKPERLRCEYRLNPLGVDQTHPELSWIVTSATRGQNQTAYRILVASNPEKLNRQEGDLWDSGKVEGNATFGIAYAGKDLGSHLKCYWKVFVSDSKGLPGHWSTPAFWSMGILDQNEWPGDWIGYDAKRHSNSNPPPVPLHGARWTYHPSDASTDAPAEASIYLGVWDLPEKIELTEATLAVCTDDPSIVLFKSCSNKGAFPTCR